jgi:hypothetical protein
MEANDLLDINPFNMVELGLEQPQYTIRTDNGTERAGSQEVRNVANKHGYSIETTAPDSSSQNGMAERPHCTLKEKVHCLLYLWTWHTLLERCATSCGLVI